MEKKLGIKETKEFLGFVLGLANATGKALEDGQVTLADIRFLIGVFADAGPAFDGLSAIPSEWKDLDKSEQEEIKQFVIKEFDIPQDKIEEIIERALVVGISLYQFVKDFFKTK